MPRVSSLTHDALAVVGATALLLSAVRAARFLLAGHSLRDAASSALRSAVGFGLSLARAVPFAAEAIEAGLDSALDGLRDDLAPVSATSLRELPARGRRASAVEAELRAAIADDAAHNGLARGTAFGGIYHALEGASSLSALHAAVSALFIDTNLLYPGIFRAGRRAEAEAVAMAVSLLRDGAGGAVEGVRASGACGLLTSGGTESVLLAVKAHRDAALAALGFATGSDGMPAVAVAARAGRVLTVVAGVTAHPAFDKACELFGLRLHKLAVDSTTLALTPAAVAGALGADTLLVVASAPGFAHGVVDDVTGIAAAARDFKSSLWGARGVPVHVDNCLGGCLLSFAHAADESGGGIPAFDFRVADNIASISMDLHKYGGSPKGASVVAFRDAARRRFCYSTTSTFPGGLYATPTLAGSRGGVPAALAWSTLVATGKDGFARAAARVSAAHASLVAGIASTPGLRLLGTPHACVVAFAPALDAQFSAYSVAARMAERSGWKVALLQSPPGAHVVVTERFAEPWTGSSDAGAPPRTVAEQWLADLRAAVLDATATPKDPAFEGKGDAAIYGAAGALPSGEVDGILRRYCDVLTCVR